MGITDLYNHIIWCHLIWTLCLYICIPHLWGGPSHIFGLLWGLRFVNKKIYCPKFINCRKVVSCNQCQSVNFEYVGKDASMLIMSKCHFTWISSPQPPLSECSKRRFDVWHVWCVFVYQLLLSADFFKRVVLLYLYRKRRCRSWVGGR